MSEPDGARGSTPFQRIRHTDPIRGPLRDVRVNITDDSDNDSASTASVE